MGNTTIIELNHDYAHEIESNPEEFIRVIMEQLSAAEHTGDRIPGGRVIAFFHRSGPIETAWNRFINKWGWGYWKESGGV